jgi:PAS domain S-box-containing protein
MAAEKRLVDLDSNVFMLAIETSLDAVVIGDQAGYISYVNQAAVEMLGAEDKADFIGKHVLDFVDTADKQRALDFSLQCMKSGRGWRGQFNVIHKKGGLIPTEITAAPIKNQNGETIAFIDVIRNVTERVQTEKQLKQAQIALEVANEKLLVMGGLVRHDIANKLNTLNLRAFLAKKDSDLNALYEAAQTASSQITRTLNFSRDYEKIGKEPLGYIDVASAFNEVAACFSEPKIKIINACGGLQVLADNLLGELLYNLVDNTLKYGKTINVIKLSYQLGGENLKLIYEDDGVGISDEAKPKLFTKGFGQGTGLGLYLAKKIVEVYGWHIKETGTPQAGVRFEISIPKSDFYFKTPS